MNKKVEIIIENRRYADSVKTGAEFTSVGFNASHSGMGSPCDNQEEVKEAIERAKNWIIEEGDIPIVNNLVEKRTLLDFQEVKNVSFS